MYEPACLVDRYALRHPMHAASPTDAQKSAGNYRMGHISVHGLDITIETPKGRRRRPEWPPMAAHYGYFKGYRAADGDLLDVFVGPNRSSELVYVVDQSYQGKFDEHKVLLSFDSKEQAVAAYLASYKPGWFVGPVTTMTIDQFKAWLKHGDQTKRIEHQVSRYSLASRRSAASPSPKRMPLMKNQTGSSTDISSYVPHMRSTPGFSSYTHQPASNSSAALALNCSASSRDIGESLLECDESSELYSIDDLYLAPDVIVDHYEWRAEEHPRHDEGAPGGVGGQFAPTGQSQSGNRPGGSLSPRMLASSREKWQSTGGGPWKPVVPGNSGAAPKSSRIREIAALPDNVKEGHQLHLSSLSQRDRFAVLDWSRRLNEAMANVHGPNEEEEWQRVSKPYIRTLLDEMNQRDREARGRGVRLSDYINANGMIPESLSSRLHGGARFFDPEHIRDKLKSGAPQTCAARAAC